MSGAEREGGRRAAALENPRERFIETPARQEARRRIEREQRERRRARMRKLSFGLFGLFGR